MKIACPYCDQRIEVGTEHSGIDAICPNSECGQAFRVPEVPVEHPDQDATGPSGVQQPPIDSTQPTDTVLGKHFPNVVSSDGLFGFLIIDPSRRLNVWGCFIGSSLLTILVVVASFFVDPQHFTVVVIMALVPLCVCLFSGYFAFVDPRLVGEGALGYVDGIRFGRFEVRLSNKRHLKSYRLLNGCDFPIGSRVEAVANIGPIGDGNYGFLALYIIEQAKRPRPPLRSLDLGSRMRSMEAKLNRSTNTATSLEIGWHYCSRSLMSLYLEFFPTTC